jgi:hypothetical protein
MSRREELERQVDELAESYSGQDFADAVQRYSQNLRPEEQEELQAILLERARMLEDAVQERVEAKGWFRRLWRDIGGPRPPRPPR